MALLMYGAYAKRLWHPEYPWAPTAEERQTFFDAIENGWGGVVDLEILAPSVASDPRFRMWWASYLQRSASPGAALDLAKMNAMIDIRDVLPTIRVPSLIIHRTGDKDIDVGGARYLAQNITGSKYVELPGDDHLIFAGDQEAVLGEIEQFLTGERPVIESDTVLATILFAEIVEAFATAARLGGEEWQALLRVHNRIVQDELSRFRGQQVQANPSGFVAIFDGPVKGIRFAQSVLDQVSEVGLKLRIGLHTGEWERNQASASGVSSEIAVRVLANASPGEVVISSTVADLVAGSALTLVPTGKRPIAIGGRRLDTLRVISSSASSTGSGASVEMPLSPRECEVCALIGNGLTNRAIADRLNISVATVERHVSNIFNKLGLHSRSQVAVWAVEVSLLENDVP